MSDGDAETLPPGWVEGTLCDVIGRDGIFCDGDWVESKDQDPNGDVRLIQLADVGDGNYRDRSSRFLTSGKAAELHCTYLQVGDLLVARMPDPLGRVCIFPGDAKPSVTVVDVCVVRSASPVHSRWLMHQMNAPRMRHRVAALQSGSTRLRISRKNLEKVRFPIPPLPEQGRIADAIDELLSDLDAGVEALKRVQVKLGHYRAAVLKAAVEGALTADWREQHPDTEPASELLKRILTERRRRWEEAQLAKFKAANKQPPKGWQSKYKEPAAPDTTNLPDLPRGWSWASLAQVTKTVMNGFGKRWQEGGVPRIVLRLADIENGEVSLAGVRRINCTPAEEEKYGLAENDLLVVRVNGSPDIVGRVVILKNINETALFCDHFIRATCVDTKLAQWIRTLGDSSRFRLHIEQNKVSSAGQNTINQEALLPFAMPLPPADEQEKILEAVEAQLSVLNHLGYDLGKDLRLSHALRQSILRHAFTGQLVPQDPKDEPASELLKRIATEREARGNVETKKPRSRAKAKLKA